MKYNIKNFKIFDQQGVTFNLAPITLLTGCNCSGKSSLVKSLMVLGDYFERVRLSSKRNGNVDKCALIDQPLIFNVGNHKLGEFSTTINENNTDGIIQFSYTKYSEWLQKNVIVTLSFVKNEDNPLVCNGKLHKVSLKLEDGNVFYEGGRNDKGSFQHKFVDLSNIRDIYIDVMYQAILQQLNEDLIYIKQACPDIDEQLELGAIHEKTYNYYKLVPERVQKLMDPIFLKDKIKKDLKIKKNISNLYRVVLDSDNQVFGDDNILALKKYKTVFYLPWFDILCDVEKSNVRSVIMKKLQGCELSEDLKYNLDFILTAFENSEQNNFIDFFLKIEQENIKDFKNFTSVNDSHFGRVLEDLNIKGFNDYSDLTGFDSLQMKCSHGEQLDNGFGLYDLFNVFAEAYSKIDPSFAKHSTEFAYKKYFNNKLYDSLKLYLNYIWEEVLLNNIPCQISNIVYVGSERAVSKRLYSFDNNDTDLSNQILQYTELMKQFYDILPEFERKFDYLKQHEKENINNIILEIDKSLKKIQFVDIWLKKLGIGDSLYINKVTDSTGTAIGCSIAIEKNNIKHSIAEEGYGCIQIISVLLAIQNTILKLFNNFAFKFIHNSTLEEEFECCIIIEEPENHLHPKLQSLLADMFLEAYENFGINFIIETHSEYLIRKSQVLVSKMGFKTNKDTEEKSPFRTYYIPSKSQPYSLGYRKDGKFAESFGPGFYDESANLTFEIM